ncbi:hypothetical protein [Lacticaseibacillus zhaodongensis]|uniref:hypothetical protein n=1 Tax=Lacticaseibacillus zhaodongensis TaxID=2668065 RepID=UPI0012D32FF4|nr:hypothetical protein [Lacticaseibacillus zhaodongensis]
MKSYVHKHLHIVLIIIMAVCLILPQLFAHNVVVGVDGMFHLNRFYDAAMQIKEHHFSYFQMNYSFNHSARIVNALYGPYFAYLAGLVLLLAGSWLRFEILLGLILEITAGYGMYRLANVSGATRRWSTAAALLYIAGGAVPSWLSTQQFTAWGAALLPYVLIYGVRMISGRGRFNTLGFAIAVAVIVETHLLSAAITLLAIIPFAVYGFWRSKERAAFTLHVLVAALLCLLLTANVWGGMLDVYGSNHLVAPFAPIASSYDATTVSFTEYGVGAAAELGLVFSVLFIGQIAYCCFKQKRTVLDVMLTGTGAAFLLLSSNVFPWTKLITAHPVLASYLQFPSRFRPVATALLLAAAAISASQFQWNMGRVRTMTSTIAAVLVALLALQTVGDMQQLADTWQRPQVLADPTGVVLNAKDMRSIKKDFASSDLAAPLNDINKVSADYLPVPDKDVAKVKARTGLHVYAQQTIPITPINKNGEGGAMVSNYADKQTSAGTKNGTDPLYRKLVVIPSLHADKYADGTGTTMKWTAKHTGMVKLPLVMYTRTQVVLNGKRLPQQPTLAKRSIIGTIQVRQRAGKNVISLHYVPRAITRVLIGLSLIAWLLALILLLLLRVWQRRNQAGRHSAEA